MCCRLRSVGHRKLLGLRTMTATGRTTILRARNARITNQPHAALIILTICDLVHTQPARLRLSLPQENLTRVLGGGKSLNDTAPDT
jgi:hypothetical protein